MNTCLLIPSPEGGKLASPGPVMRFRYMSSRVGPALHCLISRRPRYSEKVEQTMLDLDTTGRR